MGNFKESNVVLVVDDDEMNLQVAKMILEKKLQCRVLTANSGVNCLEILRSQYVRVVLLDIMMPEMDGIETLKEIRADEKFEDLPVIMLTASLDKDNIKKAAALGVKDYVRKPFMPKELIDRVSKKLVEETSDKVLVIADEDNLAAWQNILTNNFSHEFIIKTSSDDAAKILRDDEISLVIVSADLKFIEGYEILKFMAENEKFGAIPLVVTAPNKIAEMLEKINPPTSSSAPPPEHSQEHKNKIVHVVTNGIGYKLNFKV